MVVDWRCGDGSSPWLAAGAKDHPLGIRCRPRRAYREAGLDAEEPGDFCRRWIVANSIPAFRNDGDVVDQLMARISPEPNSGCWLWLGTVNDNGYGVIGIRGRRRKAHVIVYESLVGLVPVGLELDHLCRTRCCVNPRHLEAVTTRTNLLRGDGMAARQARKTHCQFGHPFDAENTRLYTRRDGRGTMRVCVTCARQPHAATLLATPRQSVDP